MSKIKQWFSSFYEDYISLNLNDYQNLGADIEINKLLIIAAIAICAAFCFMDYYKKNLHLTVKQLMRHEAKDEESAKTVFELGLGDKRAIKCALASSSQMKSLVAMVGEKKMTYEELIAEEKARREDKRLKRQRRKDGLKDEPIEPSVKCGIDFETARFYIKPEGADRASKIYNSAEICTLRTVLRCVFTVAVAVCFVLLMPELLNWVNSLFE